MEHPIEKEIMQSTHVIMYGWWCRLLFEKSENRRVKNVNDVSRLIANKYRKSDSRFLFEDQKIKINAKFQMIWTKFEKIRTNLIVWLIRNKNTSERVRTDIKTLAITLFFFELRLKYSFKLLYFLVQMHSNYR